MPKLPSNPNLSPERVYFATATYSASAGPGCIPEDRTITLAEVLACDETAAEFFVRQTILVKFPLAFNIQISLRLA